MVSKHGCLLESPGQVVKIPHSSDVGQRAHICSYLDLGNRSTMYMYIVTLHTLNIYAIIFVNHASIKLTINFEKEINFKYNGSINKEDIMIVDGYMTKNRASRYIKQKLTE